MGPQYEPARTITFPLTRGAPRSARRWLAEAFAFSPAIRDRALLLVSELVSNSVLHSGLAPNRSVGVSARSIRDGIRVEVIDHGIGIGHQVDGDGYGLRLVERTADRWGHTNHPTKVWFELCG